MHGWSTDESTKNADITVSFDTTVSLCGNTGPEYCPVVILTCPSPLYGRYVKIKLKYIHSLAIKEVNALGRMSTSLQGWYHIY